MPRKFTPNVVRIDGDKAFLSLTNRKKEVVAEAIIDLEDLGRVLAKGRWYAYWDETVQSHYVISSGVLLHRFVMDAPKGLIVDHIHHNTLDCRKGEMRICTHTQNMQNRKGAQVTSSHGERNVYWAKDRNLWRVEIRANRQKHHLGYFADYAKAVEVAEAGRKELHGEYAA